MVITQSPRRWGNVDRIRALPDGTYVTSFWRIVINNKISSIPVSASQESGSRAEDGLEER